jgi:hypothetical protein
LAFQCRDLTWRLLTKEANAADLAWAMMRFSTLNFLAAVVRQR